MNVDPQSVNQTEQNCREITLPLDFNEVTVKYKTFHKLAPGDIFKATVMDIQLNRVTIRLPAGGDITARSLVLPDARIGDNAYFIVKENNNGQILLEMLRFGANAIAANIAKEALVGAGIYPTEENMKIARTLMENNLPIDPPSLHKAVFFHYSAANLPIKEIVFLMKENFQMEQQTADNLNRFASSDLTARLNDVFKETAQLPPDICLKVIEKFIPVFEQAGHDKTEAENILAAAYKKTIKPDTAVARLAAQVPVLIKNKFSLNNLPEYYKALYTALKQADEILSQSRNAPLPAKEAVLSAMRQIEFMDNIHNCKYYAQIPFTVDLKRQTAELFVFRRQNNNKDLNDKKSVLIALDTTNIGRVETLIELNQKRLGIVFRAEYPLTLKLLETEFIGLKEALAESGYSISGVTYKNLAERFTFSDDPPAPPAEAAQTAARRYAFDMRV